jgi:transcriptional regulator with XRE-family HTH domain
MNLADLGKRIADARKSKGLSAYELSLRIGKDTSYIYKVELGKVNLSVTILSAICDELNIDICEILNTSQK